MKNIIKFLYAGIGIMIVMCAVFGAIVMLLWNALLPRIFGFPPLNYPEATGLLVLVRVLFGGLGGGFHAHGGYRGRRHSFHGQHSHDDEHFLHHGNKLREKWMNMSEEERREFLKKEKDFYWFNRRFSRLHDFCDDTDEKDNTHE